MPIEPATTVISFWVRVPVLSVQMTEAFAMVSHDPSTRTRRFSFVIRFVAKAKANVTARGSPVVGDVIIGASNQGSRKYLQEARRKVVRQQCLRLWRLTPLGRLA